MKLISIFLCLSLALAVPFRKIPNTSFEIELFDQFTDLIAEANTEGYAIAHDFFTEQKFRKRDEEAAAGVIQSINDTNIIWTLLDAVVDNPGIVSVALNLLTGPLNSNSSSGGLNLNLTTIIDAVDVEDVLNALIGSGLVTSLLDALLLDEDFRPTIVDIIYRAVEANIGTVKNLLNTLLVKRDLITDSKRGVVDSDSLQLFARAENTGSLGNFISNVVAQVLSSPTIGGIANDTVYALNDTGVAVYVVKRFLSTPKYVNATGALIGNLAGGINFTEIWDGLNFTALIANSGDLLNSNVIANVILGDPLTLVSEFGVYAGAVSDIIGDLEDKGLFVDLNNEIFPTTTELVEVVTTSGGLTYTGTITKGIAKAASSSSVGNAGSLSQNPYSPLMKMLIFAQTCLFGGLVFIL